MIIEYWLIGHVLMQDQHLGAQEKKEPVRPVEDCGEGMRQGRVEDMGEGGGETT